MQCGLRNHPSKLFFFSWLKLQHPTLFACAFHIANERKCSPQYGKFLSKLGVKAGVSDIFIAYPVKQYHGLFIEMKAKDGKPTASQIQFIDLMNQQGYLAKFCYGADEAIALVNDYLKH